MMNLRTTIKQGIVRVWDVYAQEWRTIPAQVIVAAAERREPHAILPTLLERERRRIIRAAVRHPAPS